MKTIQNLPSWIQAREAQNSMAWVQATAHSIQEVGKIRDDIAQQHSEDGRIPTGMVWLKWVRMNDAKRIKPDVLVQANTWPLQRTLLRVMADTANNIFRATGRGEEVVKGMYRSDSILRAALQKVSHEFQPRISGLWKSFEKPFTYEAWWAKACNHLTPEQSQEIVESLHQMEVLASMNCRRKEAGILGEGKQVLTVQLERAREPAQWLIQTRRCLKLVQSISEVMEFFDSKTRLLTAPIRFLTGVAEKYFGNPTHKVSPQKPQTHNQIP